jgi:hypothetical protein
MARTAKEARLKRCPRCGKKVPGLVRRGSLLACKVCTGRARERVRAREG